jgi:hypothetical protein
MDAMKANELKCDLPWTSVVVTTGGAVCMCCHTGDAPVGNLMEAPFDQIWNGEEMQARRREFLAGRFPAACLSKADQCPKQNRL